MASEQLTFNSQKDSYVNLLSPNSSYGNSTLNKAGRPANPTSGSKQVYASFFGFDLSTIPRNKVFTNAYIKLYISSFFNLNGTAPGTGNDAPIEYPIVLKCRRVSAYAFENIDTLRYIDVIANEDFNNVYDVANYSYDTSQDVVSKRGSFVNFYINELTRSEEDKYVIAIFRDDNYINANSQFWAVNIMSRENIYQPQLIVTIDDYVPPKPVNLSPHNTIRNAAGTINLAWQWEDLYMGTSQASYEIIYSTDNFTTSTTLTGATANLRTIPAGTFTNGATVKWKVRITDTNGDTSEYSDVASFTIGVTTPSTPEAISPANTIVNSSDEIFYRWKFNDLYGYSQAKFDLQYREGSAEAITITEISDINQYIMPENTISSGGDYFWRVRCYNAFNEVSPYTGWQPFYAIGRPDAPIITNVSNNATPTITWTSTDQDIFILIIYKDNVEIFNSDEQIDANLYKPDLFLEDGQYKVGIKVRNVYGFWSNETLFLFTITTVKPTKPSISGSIGNLYIALILTSETNKNLIYRKGKTDTEFKKIAEITGNTYNDYSASAGENYYYVRATNETGYNDSDIYSTVIVYNGIILSGYDNQDDMINLYQTKDGDKRKSIALSKMQFNIKTNGRKYPISQTMPFRDQIENHEYFIEEDEFEKCYRILHEYSTVLYRNNYGYCFKASISNPILQEDTFGYIVQFSATRLEE